MLERYLKKIINAPKSIAYRVINLNGFPISDETYLKILFYLNEGYFPNLNNPVTLKEKMQWLKLHDRNPLYTKLVDKYNVREYIKKEIGEAYLVDNYGVWNNFDEIDFSRLPTKFVLKCTHNSSAPIVCNDISKFDFKTARKKINKELKNNYFWSGREWPYRNVKPRVIAEKLLENNDGSALVDYKFYCYGGEPIYFMYSVGEAEHNVKNHKFDMNCNSIDYLFKEKSSLDISCISLPENINEMMRVVNVLCKGLCKESQHVRIDLYNVDGKIYFGEITYYSNSGFINIYSKDYSNQLADLIDLGKTYYARKI